MPNVYYLLDESYEPKNELERKIIEEIKKNPFQHCVRTLAVRLGITDPLEFQKLVDTLHELCPPPESGKRRVIGTLGWMRMKDYIEKIVNNPNTSITLDEIIQGTELSKRHAELTGRDTRTIEEELRLLKSYKKS